MVKRYVCHMGSVIPIAEEDAEKAWNGFNKFVSHEDYAALEAQAERLLIECANLQEELLKGTINKCRIVI